MNRYQCLCCPTSINALVDVETRGLHTNGDDTHIVNGLYEVKIHENKFYVKKSNFGLITSSIHPDLPRRRTTFSENGSFKID